MSESRDLMRFSSYLLRRVRSRDAILPWNSYEKKGERKKIKTNHIHSVKRNVRACLYGLGVPILSRTNEHYHNAPLGFPIMQIPLMSPLFCKNFANS